MSLRVTYNGAATIYALVRETSGSAWRPAITAFVPFVDGDVAEYAIPLSSLGGDIYGADFPAAIPSGAYIVQYYAQSGVAPAVTDLLLKSRKVYWDGRGTTNAGGSLTLSPYALTSLDSFKRANGISLSDGSDDDLITQCINAATSLIEQVAGRQFVARDQVEWVKLAGPTFSLDHYPVLQVYRVASGCAVAVRLTFDAAAIRATVSCDSSAVRLRSITADGATHTTAIALEATKTASELVNAVNGVPGWHATLVNDCLTTELFRVAGLDALSLNADLEFPDEDLEFNVDEASGLLGINSYPTRFPPQSIFVSYRAGYETVPAGLEQLANDIAGRLFDSVDVNPLIASESLGDYSVAYGGQAQRSAIYSALQAADLAAIRAWADVPVGRNA